MWVSTDFLEKSQQKTPFTGFAMYAQEQQKANQKRLHL
jgi:hypothetical protein